MIHGLLMSINMITCDNNSEKKNTLVQPYNISININDINNKIRRTGRVNKHMVT